MTDSASTAISDQDQAVTRADFDSDTSPITDTNTLSKLSDLTTTTDGPSHGGAPCGRSTWPLLHNEAVRLKLHDLYAKWQRLIVDLLNDIGDGAEKASRISLSLIALTEGLSLFSVLYSRDDLCRHISFTRLMTCMEPPENQQTDP